MKNFSIYFNNSHSIIKTICLTILLATISVTLCSFDVLAQWSASNPLMPTGNRVQDTQALQDAIHHDNMDNGGTLYLGQGTFFVCESIVRHSISGIFGYNPLPFNGTIQGAGKGVTIIKSVRGSGGETFTPDFEGDPITLAIFDLDYFGVKDLTFEANSEIADFRGGAYPTRGLFSYVSLGNFVYGVGDKLGADFINVDFNGSVSSNEEPEIPVLLAVWGCGGGTYNIKSCEFNNAHRYIQFRKTANATINIGGKPNEKVIFTNTTMNSIPAIAIFQAGDLKVNVSHIETNNTFGGLWFHAHPPNSSSYIHVSHSKFNIIKNSGWEGVAIFGGNWWSDETFGNVSAVISDNKFDFDDEDENVCGPIIFDGVNNGVITNNRFKGKGPVAINVGNTYVLPGSVSIIGNNFQPWETTENPWVENLYAPIWFGKEITNSIVIGGNNSENIWDLGSGNTYTGYTGVNNQRDESIGQMVKDAMRQKIDAILTSRP